MKVEVISQLKILLKTIQEYDFTQFKKPSSI